MDQLTLRTSIGNLLKKYRYVLLILVLGIVLMLLPDKKTTEQPSLEATVPAEEQTEDISSQLARILSQLKGAGKVEVMLTIAEGERTLYQTDQDITGGENGTNRTDTVIITDEQRAQSGLVQQICPPTYQGAIILCQGADNATVHLAIVEAVSRATGLGADRISVLKMK